MFFKVTNLELLGKLRGVAQMVVRRLAVHKTDPSSILVRHPTEVFPTELTSDEEMEMNLGELRRTNVIHGWDGLNVFC
jgi:hypothetical protein